MVKKIITVLCLILVLLGLNSCMVNNEKNTKEIPKKGIVLVWQYVNGAWGYENKGTFVDINGNVYTFDFSDYIDISQEETVQRLLEIYEKDKPTMSVDKEIVKECYLKIPDINTEAELKKEYAGCVDMGQQTLYAMTYNQDTLVKLCSEGDYEVKRNDKNAQEISDLYEELMK